MPELGAHNTTVAMRPGNLSPDNPELGCLLVTLSNSLALGSVDKGKALAHVELCVVLAVYTFNLDERGVGVLVPKTPLAAQDNALGV